ncbi:hypothetical protein DLAC_00670 [Tieghemostelium lacteum]|uniref:Uncharacterized protein n=1 Tax=Tieghemostelium lacteum TaxID=361077 RepID=A0A152AAC2_TIELA|nr:hypothetical protein DLAC_00670 [Tieghemostelium lacteum]|eukprot:KYR03169.1 hypothetical protein DLAC_00670 [Tieghemostelium lacteum]
MISTSNSLRLNALEKENSVQNSISKKSSLQINGAPLKQKGALTGERKALGDVTNSNTKSTTSIKNKDVSSKLLFVPQSTTPQIKKKVTSTNTPIIFGSTTTVSSTKKKQLQNNFENTVLSAPPNPLRVNSKFSNKTIENLVMTPSMDTPIIWNDDSISFDDNAIQELNFDSNFEPSVIQDNFSFSDYYNDMII